MDGGVGDIEPAERLFGKELFHAFENPTVPGSSIFRSSFKLLYPEELNEGWKDGYSLRVRPEVTVEVDGALTIVPGEVAVIFRNYAIATRTLNENYSDTINYPQDAVQRRRMEDIPKEVKRIKHKERQYATTTSTLAVLGAVAGGLLGMTPEFQEFWDNVLYTDVGRTLSTASSLIVGMVTSMAIPWVVGSIVHSRGESRLERMVYSVNDSVRDEAFIQGDAIDHSVELIRRGYRDLKSQIVGEKLKVIAGDEAELMLPILAVYMYHGRDEALTKARSSGFSVDDKLFLALEVNEKSLRDSYLSQLGISKNIDKVALIN